MEYETGYFRDKTLRTESSVFVNTTFSVEVEAIIGYPGRYPITPLAPYVVYGETSDWSNDQTVTIPASSVSPNPTSTPTVPELSWLVVTPLLLSILSIALALRHRKDNYG